jgi:hypothetical protein
LPAGALLALAAALVSAGCAPAGGLSPAGGGFVDAPKMQEEYRAEVARLEWPPSATAPPAAIEGEDDVKYGIGVGASSADFSWMCAWIGRWLETRGQPNADEALEMLDGASDLPAWDAWDDNGHSALRTAVSSARDGEVDQMQTLHQGLGCRKLADRGKSQ